MAIATPAMTLDQEINPWEAQSARFEFAARKLNLDENLWRVLSTPSREIIAALERLVGKQALELEFLKGALKNGPRPKSASTSAVVGPPVSASLKDAG